jgi:hypothetical protein
MRLNCRADPKADPYDAAVDLVVNRGFVALRPFRLHRACCCHIGAPLFITLAIDGSVDSLHSRRISGCALVADTHLAILAPPPVVLRRWPAGFGQTFTATSGILIIRELLALLLRDGLRLANV